MNRKLLAVAWWEYSEKIRSRAFLVSLVLLPAIIVGLVVVPAASVSGSDDAERVIGVLDETGAYGGTFAAMASGRFHLPDGRDAFTVVPIPHGATDLFQAVVYGDSLVVRGDLAGYFIIRSPMGGLVDAEFRAGSVGNIRIQEKLGPVLREAVTAVRLREQGVDPGVIDGLRGALRLRTFTVSRGGASHETSFDETFFSVYMYMMMLFFVIMTSGQLLVRSMLEEKSNRIVEVLLSSVPPRDIMGGKILGLGALGLTQLATWGIVATAAARFSGLPVIPLGNAMLLTIYFVLGYLFYSAIFVSAGAPLSTEQEAQQVTSILSLGLIGPLALAVPVMQDPGSSLAVALTYIPVFTPMMMAIRIPAQMPPLHEVVVSLCVLGASVYVMMRFAGRIFSASVLLSGKRLSFAELRSVLRERS